MGRAQGQLIAQSLELRTIGAGDPRAYSSILFLQGTALKLFGNKVRKHVLFTHCALCQQHVIRNANTNIRCNSQSQEIHGVVMGKEASVDIATVEDTVDKR